MKLTQLEAMETLTQEQLQHIEAIAALCRNVLESYCHHAGLIDGDEVDDDLGGACALGSWLVTFALRREGLPAIPVIGKHGSDDLPGAEHCWTSVAGHIVDVTATQFGMDEVIVARNATLDGVYNAAAWGDDAHRVMGEFFTSPAKHKDRLRRRYLRAHAAARRDALTEAAA